MPTTADKPTVPSCECLIVTSGDRRSGTTMKINRDSCPLHSPAADALLRDAVDMLRWDAGTDQRTWKARDEWLARYAALGAGEVG